jgi:molybdopterin converting factor small subunit
MTSGADRTDERETAVTVHYWAAARAAAGVASEEFAVDGPVTLADLVRRVVAAHPGSDLERVVGVCSVLVGDQPVGSRDPGSGMVQPGDVVELLPPFAGG